MRNQLFLFLALCIPSASASALNFTNVPRSVTRAPPSRLGKQVAGYAAQMVGAGSQDCVAFVRSVYRRVGIDLFTDHGHRGDNGVTIIHRLAERRNALHYRQPVAGDLVFFRNTYDRFPDLWRDSGLTHVGIVETTQPDGTVTFIHRGSKGIERSHFNLAHRDIHRLASGRVVNDFLRKKTFGRPASLASELFAGFASPP